MSTYPISIQLYSVREAAQKDFPATLKRIADMGYVGVEFAGYQGIEVAELRKIVDDLGMVVSSVHAPMPTKETLAEMVDNAKTLGHTAHISGPGFGRDVDSKDAVLRAAEKIQEAAAMMKAEGIRYGLHNHDYEFDRTFDGQTPHDILAEKCPDVFFEIDTYWVGVGGGDPAAVVQGLGPRAHHLHIKDGPMVRELAMTAVGDGKMDWQTVIGAANEATTEWIIVELDRCDTDMFEAVDKSIKYLVDNGLGRSR